MQGSQRLPPVPAHAEVFASDTSCGVTLTSPLRPVQAARDAPCGEPLRRGSRAKWRLYFPYVICSVVVPRPMAPSAASNRWFRDPRPRDTPAALPCALLRHLSRPRRAGEPPAPRAGSEVTKDVWISYPSAGRCNGRWNGREIETTQDTCDHRRLGGAAMIQSELRWQNGQVANAARVRRLPSVNCTRPVICLGILAIRRLRSASLVHFASPSLRHSAGVMCCPQRWCDSCWTDLPGSDTVGRKWLT
jgi:hypothetical protein